MGWITGWGPNPFLDPIFTQLPFEWEPSSTLGPLEQDTVSYPWNLDSGPILFGWHPVFQTLTHGLDSPLGFKSLFGTLFLLTYPSARTVFYPWTLGTGYHLLPLDRRIRTPSFWLASCLSITYSWVGFPAGV